MSASWRKPPHPQHRLMSEPEMRHAALRIRRTNILRPFVDDDQRLLTPMKLARDWGFKLEPHMAVLCLLVRRLNRPYVWKIQVASDKGQKYLLYHMERVWSAAAMFLREEELVDQLEADWEARGNQVVLYFGFHPDPTLEGFTDRASGRSNTALEAFNDGVQLNEFG